MPKNTDFKGKRRGAILCAGIVIGLMLLILGFIVLPLLRESYGLVVAIGVLALYVAAIVAVIAGVALALRQRLEEIKGGEEEDAKKY